MLVMTFGDGEAVLERRAGETVTIERRQSGPGAFEIDRSSCGKFVAVSVSGLFDAVFNAENECVYARCAWIRDLSPLGGQCECRGGCLKLSNG